MCAKYNITIRFDLGVRGLQNCSKVDVFTLLLHWFINYVTGSLPIYKFETVRWTVNARGSGQ